MYLQHFGLRHPPLGKDIAEPWDDGALEQLIQRFNWLLQSPGLGLLTGEPGVGKTAALRSLTRALNPHRHLVLYQANTDFATSRLRPRRHLPRPGARTRARAELAARAALARHQAARARARTRQFMLRST